MKAGTMYLVSTPIGNLADISYRAIEVLKSVDIIACEDTRHSRILLDRYDIHKRLISYHKNNERVSTNGIIDMLKAGKNIALISDAGMPVISDPGNILVSSMIENNIDYTIIPGANAALSALVLSGYDALQFSFVGFLPEKMTTRKDMIDSIYDIHHTVIMYSSRHNILRDIQDMASIMPDRQVCVVAEITKMHERCMRGILSDIDIGDVMGEYVIVLAPYIKAVDISYEQAYHNLISSGVDKKTAIKQIAKEYGLSKSSIYNITIE